jgi:transglutaminase-like putative cysteine protease
MTRYMTKYIPLLLLLAPGVAAAAADKPAYKRWYELQYLIRSADRMDVTQRIETEVTSASLLQSLGQHRLVNNDHFFNLDLIEAATIKPDGRRVEVDLNQIAVLSGAEATTNILFQADVKTRVIPFPELAAGDHTVIAYRVSQKQPTGLGGTSIALAFPPALYFSGMKVTVDAPADLPLQLAERALQHDTKVAGGRKVLSWTINEQPYTVTEANSTAPIDWAPMLTVSTYPSWDAVGKAEFALADPKSQPDDKVRALADDVTKGITDRRAQAAAIFDWVATNIRYYEIILNQGGWMPHAASDILKNRYGDCKDHATLMRALLRAKGIESEYVLINAMSRTFGAYQIPNSSFDHMILYLPEFDSYADPTSSTAMLGVLPVAEYDRPVLRLAARGITWTRTPALKSDDVKFALDIDVVVAADGNVTGTNVIRTSGPLSIDARNVMRTIEQRGASEVGKELLTRLGWTGTATFDVHSPFERTNDYEIKSQFELTRKLFGDDVTPAALPTGPRAIVRPVSSFAVVVRENRQQDFFCLPVSYSETIRLKLPEGRRLAGLPRSESVSRPLGEYQSSYRIDGDTLIVSRKIVWRTASSVCTRKMADDLTPVWRAIDRDTNVRVAFVPISGAAPVAAPSASAPLPPPPATIDAISGPADGN